MCFLVQKMELFKVKAEKKREELTQAEAASQEGNEGEKERRNHLDELSKEAEESSERKKTLEQDLKKANEPFKSLQRQLKQLKTDEKEADKDLLSANKALQKKRDEIAASAGSAEAEQARRNTALREAEERRDAAKAINSQLRQAVTDAYNAYESLETDVAQAKNSVDYVENQIRGAKNRIEQMRSSSGDSLNVFGQRCVTMKKMVDECAQRGKFSGPVLGPIGFYCKIQPGKEDFAGIAEFALGSGILDRFVVCNDHDRKLLQQIRRKVGCQADCGILQQAQHARYNIPDPPQVEGIETLASVISVQNDLIFNCLVDNAKIDERALSRSKEESERHLLVSDGNGRNSIRGNKIKEVFFLPVGDMWKLNKGGSIQLTSNTRKFKRTIGVDMQGAIREAERELDALKEERKIRNQEFGAINAKEREAKIHWNQCKRRMQENEKTSKDSQMEIDNIKAEERNSENVDADTSAEEEEVADAQNALEEIRKSQVDLKQAIEEKKPQIKEIQDILMEITERNKKVLEDLQKAEDALSRWYSERDQQQAKLQRKREKMEQYNNIIEQVRSFRVWHL
jgi:chromosome segregation ATPase